MPETAHRLQCLPQAAAASVAKLCPDGIDTLINMAGVNRVVVLFCPLKPACMCATAVHAYDDVLQLSVEVVLCMLPS